MLYGTILFKQEANFNDIKEVKKVFFLNNMFRVRISDKSYYFNSLEPNLDELKKSMGLE